MSAHFQYTGTDILLSTEKSLANYNTWIVEQFCRYLLTAPAKKALDFGAGVGSLSVLFCERANTPLATLEVDALQRDILRERGFEPHASLDDLPRDFDFVYTSNVLEHIEDDVATLTKLRSHMIPGGRLAVFVPAFDMIWTSLDDKVGHYRRYTTASLSKALEAAGFDVREIAYRDSVGFVLALLFRFIGDSSGAPSQRSLAFFDRFLFPISRLLDPLLGAFFGKNLLAFAIAR